MAGDHIEWEKLDRYVLGEGSPEERAALEQWVNADADRRSLADAMRTVGSGPAESRHPQTWDAPKALQHVQAKLGIDHRVTPPKPVVVRGFAVRGFAVRRAFARFVFVTGAAAAVVLGVLWRNLSTAQPADVPPRVWATAWTR